MLPGNTGAMPVHDNEDYFELVIILNHSFLNMCGVLVVNLAVIKTHDLHHFSIAGIVVLLHQQYFA